MPKLLSVKVGDDRISSTVSPSSEAPATADIVWSSPYWRSSRNETMTFEKSSFMTACDEDMDGGSHYSLDLTEPDPNALSKEDREYMLMLRELGGDQEERRISKHGLFWITVAGVTVVSYVVLMDGWSLKASPAQARRIPNKRICCAAAVLYPLNAIAVALG